MFLCVEFQTKEFGMFALKNKVVLYKIPSIGSSFKLWKSPSRSKYEENVIYVYYIYIYIIYIGVRVCFPNIENNKNMRGTTNKTLLGIESPGGLEQMRETV